MAVSFRSSSIRGSADAFVADCVIPVPAGATTDDVVICFVGQWLGTGGDATITPPAGFALVTQHTAGIVKIAAYWKRLTGSDSGSYTFTNATQQWCNGSAICIAGAVTTGDPVGANFDSGGATGATSYPSLAVNDLTFEPFLVWGAYNESTDATTPPTGYAEVQAQTVGTAAWLIPGSTGTATASGATSGSAMDLVAILLAVAPQGAAAAEITPSPVASSESIPSPALAAGEVTLTPAHLASVGAVQAPALTAGVLTITPSAVGSAGQVPAPALTAGALAITPAALESAEAVYAPTLAALGQILPDPVGSAEQVYGPQLAAGPATITPAAIAAGAVYAPFLLPDSELVWPPRSGAISITGVASGSASLSPAIASGAISLV